jgi:hypothetical protein
MIFGLKKIEHQIIFLDNDDIETPTALVGKKVRKRGQQGRTIPVPPFPSAFMDHHRSHTWTYHR